MFKKWDFLLIAAAVVLAGCLLWVIPLLRERPTSEAALFLRYSMNGQEIETVPLTEERELTIDQGDGVVNVLRLSPEGISMISSTCHNQLCVMQGQVTAGNMAERPLYHMIVCAPHRLVVELLTTDQAGE